MMPNEYVFRQHALSIHCWAAHTARLYLYILKEVEGKDVPQSFPAIIGVV